MRQTKELRRFNKEVIDKMKAEGPRYAHEVQLRSIGDGVLRTMERIHAKNGNSSPKPDKG